MKTCASIFSGLGGWEIAAAACGLRPVWAVEMDEKIAEVHRMNFPETRVIVSDASKVDLSTLERVDVLFASPPCQAHSNARSKKLAPRDDADAGLCVIDYLKALRPRRFFLENVEGYKRSSTFKAIVSALHELGYFTDQQVLNAADYGVPQTRRRLILRASREGFPAPLPKKSKWVGWYEAIEDLIPTLPESKFADWQIKRLSGFDASTLVTEQYDASSRSTERSPVQKGMDFPAPVVLANHAGKFRAFIASPMDATIWEGDKPAPAVMATTHSKGQMPRAFIARSTDQLESVRIARDEAEPIWTLTTGNTAHGMPKAFIIPGDNASNDTVRSEVEPMVTIQSRSTGQCPHKAFTGGRVVAMTPRALARFQSIPDHIKLPVSNSLACKVIGNAIPPLFAQRLIKAETHGLEVLPLIA